MKLTHIRLLVADFSECFRFYRDVLGLPLNIGDVNGPYASFLVEGAEVALFNRNSMAEAVGTSAMPSAAEARDKAAIIIAAPHVDAAHDAVVARRRCVREPTF